MRKVKECYVCHKEVYGTQSEVEREHDWKYVRIGNQFYFFCDKCNPDMKVVINAQLMKQAIRESKTRSDNHEPRGDTTFPKGECK